MSRILEVGYPDSSYCNTYLVEKLPQKGIASYKIDGVSYDYTGMGVDEFDPTDYGDPTVPECPKVPPPGFRKVRRLKKAKLKMCTTWFRRGKLHRWASKTVSEMSSHDSLEDLIE